MKEGGPSHLEVVLDRLWQRLPARFQGRKGGFGRVLVEGAGGNLLVTLSGQGLAFGLQLFLARLLKAEDYGVYSYAAGIITLAALLGRLGADTALVRFVAQYRSHGDLGLLAGVLRWSHRWVLGVTGAFGLAAAAGLWALGGALPEPLRWTLLAGCALLPPLALLGLSTGALRGLRRVALGLLPDQLVRPLSLGALVLAFLLIAGRGPEATETMVLAVASTLLALAFGQHWLRTCLPEGWRRAARETRSGEWRRVSFPLLLVAGLRRILQQTDVLVIGMVLGTTSAGIYFVAVRLAQLVAAGLGAVNSITAPLISELYSAGDHRQLQRTITHAAWGASLTSIPACLVLIFGRDFFLGLFGPEFTAAGASLILLCLAQIANALTGPVGWLLNMTGHQQVNARILAWITALNLVLNLPAILLWGIEGAALVTALLSAANNLWTWAVVRRRLKIDASVLSSWS